jgi:Cystathionine beta-lyases/cystathionine gamma-synthases
MRMSVARWPCRSICRLIIVTTLKEAINFDATKDYTYSRLSTPNRRAVEKTLAKLEGGTAAFAVSSGMAAVSSLSILETGDRLISLDDLYGGDFSLL